MTVVAKQRITTIFWAGFGCVAGFIPAWVILLVVGQCLIDYDDDNVVDWTVNCFKYFAAAFCLICCSFGAACGWATGRHLAQDYSPTNQH
jgi:hypothetical protein